MPHKIHRAVSGRRFHPQFMLGMAVVVLSLPCEAQAEMTIRGYEETRHDRFYAGDGGAFIGENFDWSGVGRSNDGKWVTMISPSHFLSAAHLKPGNNATVTFYEENGGSTSHAYTIAGGQQISTSESSYPTDLWLGKLTTPLESTHNIHYYPILTLDAESSYLNMELFNYGYGEDSDRVGRNVLDKIAVAKSTDLDGDTISQGVSMYFDYDNSDPIDVNPDETLLQGGDSGGPSFAIWNRELALLGIHWFNSGTASPKYSGDTFVPYYLGAINDGMSSSDETLTVVPEPSMLALWSLAGVVGVGYGWRRRRGQSA